MWKTGLLEGFSGTWDKKKSIWEQLFHYRESVSQRARGAALGRDSEEPQLLLQLESRQHPVFGSRRNEMSAADF